MMKNRSIPFYMLWAFFLLALNQCQATGDQQDGKSDGGQDAWPLEDTYHPKDAEGKDLAYTDLTDMSVVEDTFVDAFKHDIIDDESTLTDTGEEDQSLPADAATDLESDTNDSSDVDNPCPASMTCVTDFPFHEDRNTFEETLNNFDYYDCKATANESGPEIIYRVEIPEAGFLSAAVYEAEDVDVDVHILSDLDPNACLDRGNFHARADVIAGIYYVVVDTYVSGGIPQSGPFHVDIGFVVPSHGPCKMEVGEMPRVGDGGDYLQMPATGPIVMEAHLVTQEEPPPYPDSPTDELYEHYELSQSVTGFIMYRSQEWAPLEGGSFYGCGIGSPTVFPVLHEAWYVNMYWTSDARPAKGTRMILLIPGTNRAVVVAAGYETGPGNLSNIGGTPEETHYYLGTSHLSVMTIGIAVDQTLPFGPRVCE